MYKRAALNKLSLDRVITPDIKNAFNASNTLENLVKVFPRRNFYFKGDHNLVLLAPRVDLQDIDAGSGDNRHHF